MIHEFHPGWPQWEITTRQGDGKISLRGVTIVMKNDGVEIFRSEKLLRRNLLMYLGWHQVKSIGPVFDEQNAEN